MVKLGRDKKRLTPTKQEIRNSIVKWNNQYPLDYYWRKKYNIPFGSEEHKNITFLEQTIDYEEDVMIKEYEKSLKKDDQVSDSMPLVEGKRIVTMSQTEIDDEFDNLDLSKFADKTDIKQEEQEDNN